MKNYNYFFVKLKTFREFFNFDKMSNAQLKKVTVLVLARKGSKGIPSKNLAELGGKSLIARTLNILKDSQCFSEIWVSTDDDKITEISRACGAFVHQRAAYTATDDATSVIAVQEFLQKYANVDHLCLVQCTSPFMKPSYLVMGYEKYVKEDFDSVFSVTRKKVLRWSEGTPTSPLNFEASNRFQRQKLIGDICENGMFYFTHRKWIQQGLIQGGRCSYIEVPEEDSLDIDSQMDLFIAQQILSYRQRDLISTLD